MSETFPSAFERQALDLAPVMVREFSGRISLWTQGMRRIYRYSAQDALGRVAHDLLRTAFPKPLHEIEEEVRDTGAWRGELVERRGDGERIVVASQWALLSASDGADAGFVVCNSDITEAANNKGKRDLLANIVEDSQDAIVGKDLDGIITSWNKAAEEIFGYAAADIVGQPIMRLFPPGLAGEEDEIVAKLRRGERIEHYETVRLRRDGAPINVSLTVSPIRDATGRVVGGSKIIRDITEQVELRTRLNQVQEELLHISRLNDMGQLAAAFAHELNQPLSAVGNFLGATRRLVEKGDTVRALETCEMASTQLDRLAEVVRRLYGFVSKHETEPRVEDIGQVIDEAAMLGLMGHSRGKVKIEVAVAGDARQVRIDRVLIEQVLVNLIKNAAEAMSGSPERKLLLRVRRANDTMVEVEVADTGPGLSPTVRDSLFQPFTTTKQTGMGIGLSLCRSIVEGHNGTISAENGPSGGAVFRFTVPAA